MPSESLENDLPVYGCPVDRALRTGGVSWRPSVVETGLIFLLFAVYAGQMPPAVNEAHYLAKAKHYWNPSWCAGDLFLESADAHLTFYWTLGWLTAVMPLPAVAWCGRIVSWALLAVGWQRLSSIVAPWRWLSVLSAGMWLALIDYGEMAGEWVIGGVEAKCLAYGFVLLALTALQRDRWSTALLLLGVATACHVLVGGWALIAAGVAWLACGALRPRWWRLVPAAVASLLIALAGVVPGLALTAKQDPAVVLEANWIYVFGRLGHHLLFHQLATRDVVSHVLVLVLWVVVGAMTPCRMRPGYLGQRPLRGFVGGAVLLAIIGAALDWHLRDDWVLSATFLKYYWFRLSDVMLPAGAALAVAALLGRWSTSRRRVAWASGLVLAALVSVHVVQQSTLHGLLAPSHADLQLAKSGTLGLVEPSRVGAIEADWRQMCERIADQAAPTDRFLTPRSQMTFKWYAQRAEVLCVKDVPQDARSVIEWQDRRDAIFTPDTGRLGLIILGPERLMELARRYGATHVVADLYLGGPPLDWLEEFADPTNRSPSFRVYRVPGR